MMEDRTLSRAPLKAPRAGAIAGIVFSLLFLISLVLTRISIPADPHDAGAWLERGWRTVRFALGLLPFAGIAFLWFIGVLRDRLGACEDRFFATVFLGSGLLFIAMLFVASAVTSGMLMSYESMPDKLVESGIYRFGRAAAYQVMNVYAMKMAGVFMISTCTASIRTGIFPRWMAILGYALALLLLLTSGFFLWTPIVFPLWVLLVSMHILLANLRPAITDGKDDRLLTS
jgi:hypothetical protein